MKNRFHSQTSKYETIRWTFYRFKYESSVITNLAILLYVCHSTEHNKSIYDWATLVFIGNLFERQLYRIRSQRTTNSARYTQVYFLHYLGLIEPTSGLTECTHYEWLFDAACEAEASYFFENKVAVAITVNGSVVNGRPHYDNRFYCTSSSWCWRQRCLVAIAWCNLPRISCHTYIHNWSLQPFSQDY